MWELPAVIWVALKFQAEAAGPVKVPVAWLKVTPSGSVPETENSFVPEPPRATGANCCGSCPMVNRAFGYENQGLDTSVRLTEVFVLPVSSVDVTVSAAGNPICAPDVVTSTGLGWLDVAPLPSWPSPPSPQHLTPPEVVSAQVW